MASRQAPLTQTLVPSEEPLLSTASAAYARVLRRLELFARDRYAPILIEGESGTGKTSIARLIHRRSPRAAAPFHSVVLSTLDDSLASSELFGHVVGAFTDARANRAGHFACAHGGTLFRDEVGKTSRAVQQKLLHAIEYGEIRAVGSDRDVRVDFRVVAATNVPLADLVTTGDFLPDLLARLETFRVVLPPLRQRRADIPELVQSCLAKHVGKSMPARAMPEIAPDLMKALRSASWPGNLRQLDAVVHRLAVESAEASVISLEHCLDDLAWLRETNGSSELTADKVDSAITSAGSVSGAARLLGVDRSTLHRFKRRRGTSGEVQQSASTSGSVAPQLDSIRGPVSNTEVPDS